MINPSEFYKNLIDNRIDFFTGVPDSLLKDFCAYIEDNAKTNIITANEGNSIGLAAGHYLATGRPAVVYMQNSGIGNAVNPLVSLMDEDVYKIPVLMLIGWRGEPGFKDEPQHKKQGKITLSILECLGIDYIVINKDSSVEKLFRKAIESLNRNKPFAIVVQKETFEKYTLKNIKEDLSSLEKEKAIEIIVDEIDPESLIVSTTGKLSRELFEIREKNNQSHSTDFLTVGSMGHTSQIAIGVAISNPDKKVYCFDGDGSVLMHMGSLAVNASKKVENFKHIVFNNGAHASVGGQPTVGRSVSFSEIASSCGSEYVKCVDNERDLRIAIKDVVNGKLQFLEILVKEGSREDLGRPTISPQDCKMNFMESM